MDVRSNAYDDPADVCDRPIWSSLENNLGTYDQQQDGLVDHGVAGIIVALHHIPDRRRQQPTAHLDFIPSLSNPLYQQGFDLSFQVEDQGEEDAAGYRTDGHCL